MDFLIPIAVLLLAVAGVALVLAKRGKARQAARTAQLYGARSTYQPTFDVPESQLPNSLPASENPAQPRKSDAADSGSGDNVRDLAERLANDIRQSLLKGNPKGEITVETTVTTTSTTEPRSHTTRVEGGSPSAGSSQPASGTKFTESSLSLTEADAVRIKALAAAGNRAEALSLLTAETGLGGMAAGTMLEMITEAEL